MPGFRIKTLFSTILILTMMNSSPALAQDTAAAGPAPAPSASESYLKDIRDTLLININKLPVYLNQLTKMALSWLAPDDSPITAALQSDFTTLTNTKLQNAAKQLENQQKLTKYFLGDPSQENFPTANDIAYQTLLNNPYFNPDPRGSAADPAGSYIKYAAGLNMRHLLPVLATSREKKKNPAIDMYLNYYNTASAVQTYNGYILSELYVDAKNNNKSRQTQDSLIQQASNSNWFTQVASENLGMVLRQILLYHSQTYVLLAQLLETQKKLLVAQTMNNALLIAVNLEAENRVYSKANNETPI